MRIDRGEEEQKIREERDPWLHEDRSGRGGFIRTDRGEEEQKIREERVEQSIQEERE